MRLPVLLEALLLEAPPMRRLLLELKIAGINFPLVTAALSLALVLFAALAGELLDFAPIAFEVVFPLYAAIAVGEKPAKLEGRNMSMFLSPKAAK